MSADSCKYTWRAVTANSIHNDWGSQDPWPEESHNPYTPFAVKQCHCKPDALKKKGTLNFFLDFANTETFEVSGKFFVLC